MWNLKKKLKGRIRLVIGYCPKQTSPPQLSTLKLFRVIVSNVQHIYFFLVNVQKCSDPKIKCEGFKWILNDRNAETEKSNMICEISTHIMLCYLFCRKTNLIRTENITHTTLLYSTVKPHYFIRHACSTAP